MNQKNKYVTTSGFYIDKKKLYPKKNVVIVDKLIGNNIYLYWAVDINLGERTRYFTSVNELVAALNKKRAAFYF